MDVTGLEVQLQENALVIITCTPPAQQGEGSGILTIGTQGRLLSLELGPDELRIADPLPPDTALARSASVQLRVVGRRVTLPRRGPGWEISFPSGNQCWRVSGASGGQRVCSVVPGEG